MPTDAKDALDDGNSATTPTDSGFEPVVDASAAPEDTKLPRFGQGGVDEKPVEAEGDDNPIYHSGHVPLSPTTK